MAYRRRKKSVALNTFLISSTVVVVGVIGLLMRPGSGDARPGPGGCPAGTKPTAVVSVLLDETDALSPKQAGATKQILHAEIERAPACANVLIYVLSSDWNGLPTPKLSAIRPARKHNETTTGATDVYLERQYTKFLADLDGKIDETLAIKESSPQSPILEYALAIETDTAFQAADSRRFVVVSDMLQNTDSFNESANATVDSKKALGSPYFKSLSTNLAGTTVEVYYLQRGGKQGMKQTQKHKYFVQAWFTSQSASIARIIPLPQ